MAQHIIVTDYDSRWPAEYEKESEKIKAILGENCVAIYHIGSTAVPGLAAKPIIDIAVAVHDIKDILPYIEVLKQHNIFSMKELLQEKYFL